ncbi:sensor histidine kinase [Inhella sp.]|uniref:sensor histidine kinase n=1 Tax=Inhella sp. TaxID=1921806 RepID=UPI0035AEE912
MKDPRRGPRSLFGELLDWMLAPMLVIWPIGVLLTYAVAEGLAAKPFDRSLTASAQMVAERLRMGADARTLQLSLGGALEDDEEAPRFQVLGQQGQLVAGELRLPVPPRPKFAGGVQLRDEEIGGEPYRVAALWLHLKPQDKELALVQVAETPARRRQLATEIVRGVTLPLFLLLPLSALLAWWALVQGFKPMHELQQRIRERSAEDLSPIDEDDAPQEVQPLVRAVNELLARREQVASSQRQFLADAAHQLKTPLAGLRTQAELAGRALRAGELQPAELERSFAQIALSSQRAAHMVNQLLALARAEGAALEQEPIDLAELAREVTQDFVPQALAKRIDLGYEGPERGQLRVGGQRWQLVELLRNLTDNALRYTPQGGEVTVRVTEDLYGQVVVLQVEDSGPGIAPEARERVFQPFYRQLGTGTEGSGLGLTIAGQIAERHGSRIELDDARPRRGPDSMPGARFTLRLAASAAVPPEPALTGADPAAAGSASSAPSAASVDSRGRSAGA